MDNNINKQISKPSLLLKMKQWFREERRVLITSSSVAGAIVLLRLGGFLQLGEWAALDQMFRLRPKEPIDERVVIVQIDETDLQQIKKWPIPDGVMAKMLQKLNALKPRAIGLDIYRDLPQEPGNAEFIKTAASMPNLVGIELIKDEKNSGVAPPPVLSKEDRVGFNNVVVDADGKVRRSVMFWFVEGEANKSLALQLSLIYLQAQGIAPEEAADNPKHMQLGKAVFKWFEPNDGGYVRADASGLQILSNFRSPSSFTQISMRDVLADKVPPDLVRDRVVLIGTTATSIRDIFLNPYSGVGENAEPIFGVEMHAHFVSQILSAALDGRPLINTFAKPIEILWILVWSMIGAALCWELRSPRNSAISIILGSVSLVGISYLAFLGGYWIPLVPPLLSMAGSAVVITGHLAHQEEELKRSKEFLQKVINSIPDPIFVKDKQNHWIILNEAYCKFTGYPLEMLIEKSAYDVFPEKQADIFLEQSELVFSTGKEQENEEEITDSKGNTYLIATKRSLHTDAAGNVFLVGVMRDITERKRIEEDLKRTAAELMRSNSELKVSEDRLRYLAYHDPLTGLPNRKQFEERLNQSLEWASNSNRLVALLFLDLDGFKQVNDTRGHDIGDQLLKVVAQRLTGCLRGSDTVSRLGGDEFTVILPGIPKPQDAERVAEKILSTLSEAFMLEAGPVFVTASIGVSVYPVDGDEAETLIKNADTAMYRAKELGRNQFFPKHSLDDAAG